MNRQAYPSGGAPLLRPLIWIAIVALTTAFWSFVVAALLSALR